MDPEARREAVLGHLAEGGYATVEALARRLSVSQMTIRRDLDRLEQERLVHRTHGGALLDDSVSGERTIDERVGVALAAKRAIGRASAALIEDGDTVIVDAGTTTLELARHLVGRRGVTVISNSLRVLETLSRSAELRVLGTGGELKQRELAFVGPVTETMLAERRATIAFISASGCTLTDGPTDHEDAEVAVKRAMIAASRRRYLVLDATKFGRVAPLVISPLTAFDGVVTDAKVNADVVRGLTRRGVKVIRAQSIHALQTAR
jgi:DeoR family fructose operon transcriptional repressor